MSPSAVFGGHLLHFLYALFHCSLHLQFRSSSHTPFLEVVSDAMDRQDQYQRENDDVFGAGSLFGDGENYIRRVSQTLTSQRCPTTWLICDSYPHLTSPTVRHALFALTNVGTVRHILLPDHRPGAAIQEYTHIKSSIVL